MQTPSFTLTIFGITGDLSRNKVIPSLYELFTAGEFPRAFRLIGYGRRPFSAEEFRNYVQESLPHAQQENLHTFLNHWEYVQGEFDQPDDFTNLAQVIKSQEHREPTPHIFYLAVAPEFYTLLSKQLKNAGLLDIQAGITPRIMIEKPFGHNAHSADELNAHLHEFLTEEQIYRIDHYLGKPAMRTIRELRQSSEYAPVWNTKAIDHIQITLAEQQGIGNRGAYYDQTGAISDMLQNHGLNLLTQLTMELPQNSTASAVRHARYAALQSYTITEMITGQYASYLAENHVKPNSTTETFAAAKLLVHSPLWQNLPVYMRTGKKLAQNESLVEIIFKDTSEDPLTISLATTASRYSDYANLIASSICGDQTLFIDDQEVLRAWNLIDEAKQQLATSMPLIYEDNSWGPNEANELIQKDNRIWTTV